MTLTSPLQDPNPLIRKQKSKSALLSSFRKSMSTTKLTTTSHAKEICKISCQDSPKDIQRSPSKPKPEKATQPFPTENKHMLSLSSSKNTPSATENCLNNEKSTSSSRPYLLSSTPIKDMTFPISSNNPIANDSPSSPRNHASPTQVQKFIKTKRCAVQPLIKQPQATKGDYSGLLQKESHQENILNNPARDRRQRQLTKTSSSPILLPSRTSPSRVQKRTKTMSKNNLHRMQTHPVTSSCRASSTDSSASSPSAQADMVIHQYPLRCFFT